MGDNYQVTREKLDVLKEVGNIGAGNAATSLASLLGLRVDIAVPRAAFLPMEETINDMGGMEEPVACVQLEVEGDIKGLVIYLFDQDSSFRLVDMLLGQPAGTTTELGDMESSVLSEAGNILTGAFLSAISSMTRMDLKLSVPLLAFDMLGAVLASALLEGGYAEDQVLTIKTEFAQGGSRIGSRFILVMDPESLEKIVNRLMV
ncbi:MAG: chemotaxis protein CheC [Peptococcaceae bacterium]|nr:chemotaxis protein CheC [Peptococcaceae bacterium]